MARILAVAAILGLLGPLPGYIAYAFTGSAEFLFGGWKNLLYALAWYPSAALMFGPFCLGAALVGLLVIRLAQESPRAWLKPALIVALPLLAAVPVCLVGFPEFAVPSSLFWSAALFLFRDRLFAPEPSPGFQKAYRWLTEFR